MKINYFKYFLNIHVLFFLLVVVDNVGVNFYASTAYYDENNVKLAMINIRCKFYNCKISISHENESLKEFNYFQIKFFNKLFVTNRNPAVELYPIYDNMYFGLRDIFVINAIKLDHQTVIFLRDDSTPLSFSATYTGKLSTFSNIYNGVVD